jgi:hypothetical protein
MCLIIGFGEDHINVTNSVDNVVESVTTLYTEKGFVKTFGQDCVVSIQSLPVTNKIINLLIDLINNNSLVEFQINIEDMCSFKTFKKIHDLVDSDVKTYTTFTLNLTGSFSNKEHLEIMSYVSDFGKEHIQVSIYKFNDQLTGSYKLII